MTYIITTCRGICYIRIYMCRPGHSPTLLQSNGAPHQEVVQPARSGHQQIAASLQLLHLASYTGSSIHCTGPQSRAVGVFDRLLMDLWGKLSSRHQHQALGAMGAAPVIIRFITVGILHIKGENMNNMWPLNPLYKPKGEWIACSSDTNHKLKNYTLMIENHKSLLV